MIYYYFVFKLSMLLSLKNQKQYLSIQLLKNTKDLDINFLISKTLCNAKIFVNTKLFLPIKKYNVEIRIKFYY